MTKSFEEFLEDKYFKVYTGVKDDFEGSFDRWLSELDGEEYIQYADMYGIDQENSGYERARKIALDVFNIK